MKRNLVALSMLIVLGIGLSNAQVIHVAADATGNNDGTSWTDAYADLQDAIAFVNGTSGSYQIWIKAGTYYPTSTTDRSVRFVLSAPSTRLYGGFDGTETLLADRDPKNNVTILSGNIGDPNLDTDNSYSLINFASINQQVHGFTIQDIYGDTDHPNNYGAVYPNPGLSGHVLSNCIFRNNYSPGTSSVLYMYSSLFELTNCVFRNNDGPSLVAIFTSNSIIEGNLFFDNPNSVAIKMTVFAGNIQTVNNTLVGNGTGIEVAGNSHGIYNNILWSNGTQLSPGSAAISHNIIEGTSIANNYDFDPGFNDPETDDYSISVCSFARNLGSNAYATISTDLAGNTRIFDGTVDVGAYEAQGFPIQINAVETLDIACFGTSTGEIALGVTGGVGDLEYSLDGVNFQTSPIFTEQPSGSYTIEVRDADGCMDMTSAILTELSTSELSFTTSQLDNECPGASFGEINISASGGEAPYMYSIDGSNYQSGNLFENILSGNYTVYILDAVGCEVTSQVILTEPDPFTISVTQDNLDFTVSATGGTGSYEYSLDGSTFQSNNVFNNLTPGSYTFTVRDANGCTHSSETYDLVLATTNPRLTIYPNPASEYINIEGLVFDEVSILDLTGREVLKTHSQVISVNQLSSGIHFVRVIKGNRVIHQQKLKIN